MRTVNLSYDRYSRVLTADGDYGGTTADVATTVYVLSSVPEGAVADLVLDLPYVTAGEVVSPCSVRFQTDGAVSSVRIPFDVLRHVRDSVDAYLRLTFADGTVENSSKLLIRVSYTPDPVGGPVSEDSTSDLVVTRNGSWTWVREWAYEEGAVVYWDGILWSSLSDGNRGNEPNRDSEFWTHSVDVVAVAKVLPSLIEYDTEVTEDGTRGVTGGAVYTYVGEVADGIRRENTEKHAMQDAIIAQTSQRVTELRDSLGTVASLDYGNGAGQVPVVASNGRLDPSLMPDVAISEFKGVASSVEALTRLTAEKGDYAIVSGSDGHDGSYIVSGDPTTVSGWTRISQPQEATAWGTITGSVTSQTDLVAMVDETGTRAYIDAKTYTDTKLVDYATVNDALSLKLSIDRNTSDISDVKRDYLTKEDASATYVTEASLRDEMIVVGDTEPEVTDRFGMWVAFVDDVPDADREVF